MPLGKSFTEEGFWMDHVANACLLAWGGVNLIHHKPNADSAMLLFFFLSCLLFFSVEPTPSIPWSVMIIVKLYAFLRPVKKESSKNQK
jgi:hypothetical protein